MSLAELLHFLQQAGVFPLLVLLSFPFVAFPGSILLSLFVAKKFIFSGAGQTLTALVHTLQEDSRQRHQDNLERIKVDVQIEERLRDLAEQFKMIVEGLFENRRTLDDRLSGFGERQEKLIEQVEQIFRFIPKRREDWLKEEQT